MIGGASQFSDFIVYVDESGDHSLTKFDPEFPVFVLSFCVFRKDEYISHIVPALQGLKFKYFGHDMIVFHEREIRKAFGKFDFLTNTERRDEFMSDLNRWVEQSPFMIIAVAIRKEEFSKKHIDSRNPYLFAMRLGLERIETYLREREPQGRAVHFVFEARGKREDDELELEFRRVCDGSNVLSEPLPFHIVFAAKHINSSGLQLADLTARPVGRHVMNPDQPNRAYEIIKAKMDNSYHATIAGWGLTTYP